MSSNNLGSLPIAITQLVNLKKLELRNNNLSQFNHVPYIPTGGSNPSIGCATETTNLEDLRLSGNPDLVAVTECICDLDLDMGGSVDIDIVPNGV